MTSPHPLRVAVDGPDTAGKTTLADELAVELTQRGREVIRSSIDGFHRQRAERYRQGSDSWRGYYEDSFDYQQIAEALLDPLGPGGNRAHRTRVFDYRRDAEESTPTVTAANDALLVFDGVFLLRPELAAAWDVSLFLSISEDEIIRRARTRDANLFGSADEAEARYRQRYLRAQRHYAATVRPDQIADIVISNDDPKRPKLLRL
jgi:uridine kinase